MHERLRQSPLREAVLDVRVEASGESRTLVPGRMAQALEDQYPEASETPAARAGNLVVPAGAGLVATHQFRSADGQHLVQLGVNGLSIHSTSYTGFDQFRDRLSHVLTDFFRIAQTDQITRLGLRYINALTGANLSFPDMTAEVSIPAPPGGTAASFVCRGVFEFNEPAGKLGVVFGAPHDTKRTLLDMDFYSESPGAMNVGQILEWTDGAHEHVYQAFRAMLTDACYRQLLEGDQ